MGVAVIERFEGAEFTVHLHHTPDGDILYLTTDDWDDILTEPTGNFAEFDAEMVRLQQQLRSGRRWARRRMNMQVD